MLASCYRESLTLAVNRGLRTIAFPAISCGIYGYPIPEAARVAVGSVSEATRVLVVVARGDELGWRSLRNLPNVHVIAPDQLNTYDVLVCDDVVFTAEALETFLAGPPRGRRAGNAERGAEQEEGQ